MRQADRKVTQAANTLIARNAPDYMEWLADAIVDNRAIQGFDYYSREEFAALAFFQGPRSSYERRLDEMSAQISAAEFDSMPKSSRDSARNAVLTRFIERLDSILERLDYENPDT